jgi:hypothetical protein
MSAEYADHTPSDDVLHQAKAKLRHQFGIHALLKHSISRLLPHPTPPSVSIAEESGLGQSIVALDSDRLTIQIYAGPSAPRSPSATRAATGDSNASSQVPTVEALLYSVARFSKKLVCSTALSISSSQGSGFFET